MIDLIPAIDIMDGKCVRLTKGDYDTRKCYRTNPVEVACEFEDMGVKRLHLVDLDGAREKHVVNLRVLNDIKNRTGLTVDFGGGIKEEEDLKQVFQCGADLVTLGSVAATDRQLVLKWVERYGRQHFIIGADVLDGRVRIRGWKEDGGLSLDELVGYYVASGVNQFLCTDISRDGMLQGPNVELYRGLLERYPNCYLIASGGVSSTGDFEQLEAAGVPAVVFGKAYYEGKIDLEKYLG